MTKHYRIGDMPTIAERKALGGEIALTFKEVRVLNNLGITPNAVVAVKTGEFRPPKAGEWFLSGAIVTAYRAPNDLTTPFHIASLKRL